jgi:protein-tyrosine phosphatase
MKNTLKSLDFSQIHENLYLSAFPRSADQALINSLNIRLILAMHWIKPSRELGQPPVRLLWLPTIDHPFTPIPMRTLLRGVESALPVIQDGYSVLVHCRWGVHRSVAMACCVLIGLGYTADEAMHLVKQRREVADPDIWYIRNRIRKFETFWLENNQSKE